MVFINFNAPSPSHQNIILNASISTNVVICDGKYATKYHISPKCRGLKNCKGKLYKLSIIHAKEKGYSSCKICYRVARY